MTVTLNRITAIAIMSSSNGALSSGFGVAVGVLLLGLLVLWELVQVEDDRSAKEARRILSIGIIPLALTIGYIITLRLAELLR